MITIKNTINFIKRMRRLIQDERYAFEPRSYNGKDYVTVLLEDFAITPDDAIKHVCHLNQHLRIPDEMPVYSSTGAYVFKKMVNHVMAYIKLKIEEDQNGEILVVISFHKDY